MKRVSLLFALLLIPAIVQAEVQVRDDVAATGEAVMLAARTKGLILPRGGELVEFSVDDETLGKNLSGGDGWAFREFTPKEEKPYKVEAKSGEHTGKGYLLVLREGRGIIFIDVQGSLTIPPFSRDPRQGSLDAVKRISEKFHIAYLSTELPTIVIKKWLEENGFPDAPLLSWRGGGVFDYVTDKGLKVKAVIGTTAVAESAREYKGAMLFTFETSDHATEVDSWEDVEKGLK